MKQPFYRRGMLVEADEVEVKVVKLPRAPAGHRVPLPTAVKESLATLDEARAVPVLSPIELAAISKSEWAVLRPGTWEAVAAVVPADLNPHVVIIREPNGEIAGVDDTLIVKFAQDASREGCERVIRDHGMDVVRSLAFAANLYEVRTNDGTLATEKSVELHERRPGALLYAEPVLIRFGGPRHRPNDELYPKQWQWPNVGAELAWDLTRGSGATIAVVDRGFHHRHRDLAPNIDPRSGRFDSSGNFSTDMSRMPYFSHGSFCAAQAAAVANDGYGTCGIAPEAKLVLIALSSPSSVTQRDLACAIAYAAAPWAVVGGASATGADVLTCAEGPPSGVGELELVLEEALAFAHREGRQGRGMPVFWSVANRSVPIENDRMVSYPTVIRVGSSDAHNKVASACAYGPELDFLAPGEDVWNVEGNYWDHGPDSGTSFASPVAAGIAALMLSVAPHLSAEDLRRLMRQSCRKVDTLSKGDTRNDRYGYGIVDAVKAVMLAQDSANGN